MRYPLALAGKEVGLEPARADFPSLDGYLGAWHYWRAVRRDTYPTPAELDAIHGVLRWALGIDSPTDAT